MSAEPTELYECQCDECGHQWTTIDLVLPHRCPNHKCRSSYWNASGIDKQRRLRKRDGKPGYVYVIRCGEYYKIGMTLNLDRRVSQLAIQLPHTPEIICLITTTKAATEEKRLHRLYAAKRLNGEWFALTEEQVEEIKALIP